MTLVRHGKARTNSFGIAGSRTLGSRMHSADLEDVQLPTAWIGVTPRRLALFPLFVSLLVPTAHAEQGFYQVYSKQTVPRWSRNVEEIPTRRGTAARLAIHTVDIGGCWASDLGGNAALLGEHRMVNSPAVLNAWIDVCEGRTPSLNSLLFDLHYGPKGSLTGREGSCNCTVNGAGQICNQSRWANSNPTFQRVSNSGHKSTHNKANGVLALERDFFCLFRLQVSRSRRTHIRRWRIRTTCSSTISRSGLALTSDLKSRRPCTTR
jgi:hypothetical protein